MALLAALPLFLATGGADPKPTGERARKAFVHGGSKGHVRNEWFTDPSEPEVERDCKGCHRYPARGQAVDPQPSCLRCHYADSMVVEGLAPNDALSLDGRRTPGRAFDHFDHRGAACRDCHLDKSDPGAREPIVESGTAACIACHDPKSPAGMPVAKQKLTEFLGGLNASPCMAPSPKAVFRHADHVPAGKERDPKVCAACHTGLLTAPRDRLGPAEFDLPACRNCHEKDAARTPVAFQESVTEFTSRAAGTFPHDRHLSAAAFEKDPKLRAEGCLACHDAVVDAAGTPTYGLKGGYDDYYRSCTECHQHGERRIADHGTVDGCMDCHAIGGGDMKSNRPRATPTRERPASYEFSGQAHPLVSGATIDDDCKRCHRAAVELLPTRLGRKKFSHDTHLPPNPASADCTACHTKVSATKGPEAPATEFYAPDLGVCKDCHRGAPIVVAEVETVRLDVARFPHDKHLGEKARAKDAKIRDEGCLACHVPPQNGEPGVGVVKGAADCLACHDHGKRPEITGGKDRAYVAQCQPCHASGVPNKGVELPKDTRRAIVATLDAQHHPAEPACRECHVVVPPAVRRKGSPPATTRVFGNERRESPHEGAGRPENCTACHWVDAFFDAARRGRNLGVNPTRATVRGLGNDMADYPGGNAK